MRLAIFQTRPRLEEGFLKAATYRHHFTSRFHRGANCSVGGAEFIERPAWNLHYTVIESRFEGCGRPLARNWIGQFIKGVADRDESCHASNRISSSLARQSRGTRYAWINLDYSIIASRLLDGELNVTSTLDIQPSNEAQCGVSKHLVVTVREGLLWSHDDRFSSVNSHRVNVFHCADDNRVVGAVAHNFVFVLLPAKDAHFDENLTNCRMKNALTRYLDQLTHVMCRSAT